jgi:type II secretory pathway component PulK
MRNYRENISRDGGSVFILVLWTLFFLGALAMAVATLVSSSINLASHIKQITTARSLAYGGVDFTITEIMGNVTNWEEKTGKEMASDAELFKDNDTLDGGTFTVYYEHIDEGDGLLVTNYGVIAESSKENINSMSVGKMENVFDEISDLKDININAESLAKEIYTSRHLTKGGDSSYSSGSGSTYHCYGKNGKGRFELLQELLLLNSFQNDAELFAKLEPYLTVYPKDYYKATAVGRALLTDGYVGQPELLAEVKVDFVFNGKSGKIVYWHEY